MWIETPGGGQWADVGQNSFASNGECGLKQGRRWPPAGHHAQFIRQQWRMWIETTPTPTAVALMTNSFASNGECGLKQPRPSSPPPADCQFIRQQWRMWIETVAAGGPVEVLRIHSPAMANVD